MPKTDNDAARSLGFWEELWKGESSALMRASRLFLIFWVASTVALACYAFFGATTLVNGVQRTGAGLMLGGAAAGVGALLGFLFGIPRWDDAEKDDDAAPNAKPNGDGTESTRKAARVRALRRNPSMYQISDWVTKTLVGAGLTQLMQIPAALAALSTGLAPLFGAPDTPLAGRAMDGVFGVAIVLNYALLAFFFGYFQAELFFPGALREVEESALRRVAAKLEGMGERFDALAAQQREAALENRAFRALYGPEPVGFSEAISAIEELREIRSGPISSNASMYLGCALAQKYSYLTRKNAAAHERDEVRTAALAAVRDAAMNESNRVYLLSMLNGETGDDDDLTVFKGDPEFEQALGAR